MAQDLTDNRQIDKILTDKWHLHPPIQILIANEGWREVNFVHTLSAHHWITMQASIYLFSFALQLIKKSINRSTVTRENILNIYKKNPNVHWLYKFKNLAFSC